MQEPAAEVTDAEHAQFDVYVRKPEAVDAPVFEAQDGQRGHLDGYRPVASA